MTQIRIENLPFGSKPRRHDYRSYNAAGHVCGLALRQRDDLRWNVYDIQRGGEPKRNLGKRAVIAELTRLAS
jgi:hypothetical protein